MRKYSFPWLGDTSENFSSVVGMSSDRMHHTKLPAYLREQKKYHLAHHYKNFELGFGVTSAFYFLSLFLCHMPSFVSSHTSGCTGKIWDYVFNTVIPL